MQRAKADLEYIDMFGGERFGKRGTARKRGHAAWPGTGPDGEKCKTCKHITRNNRYFKCNLTRWTCGAATDIRCGDPACEKWDKKND